MLLRVNGDSQTTAATTLEELIQEIGLKTESLVVEHNEHIIRQELWAKTRLQDQDQVELLSFVGGG
ncbi:sulfur carrier protein ThiS [Desulfogranum japonicum]|uniref:sulfur carrier protein ThiS n=1 Tax=Desulfogranum japonicum TaxID=231447 RepID=UPI0003FAA97B|nr:sulfur carrier protein ThiS [Desulfogranum japonicum]